MNEAALQVLGLRKVYANGKTALAGVDLQVAQGAFHALLGPNGAGKSTLINILADTVRPTSGLAKMLGRDVFRERSWCKRHLGVVPQEVAFDPFFSPVEILRITSGLFGCRPDESWIRELLERLGLAEHAYKNTRQLSGGMRRRLLVAQALVHRPALVVLDEPTAGVDVELRRSLWSFMRELNRSGTTILLTTHYLEEAEQLCDHVTIIDGGQVVADRSMRELMEVVAGRYLFLGYGDAFELSEADARALSAFRPRVMSGGVCLHLGGQGGEDLGFHRVYEAAVSRLGIPRKVEIRQEDLEDVFIRLTGHARKEKSTS
ncbi:MAG: ABC transporter ATP-binding protein [Zetaproteobacteria bacterium]|nr:MAG: ABC transporter ATP-binding protein [Zetaproteobacteria bacterium]